MIVTLLSTPAKTCVSHRARSFAASRKTADPRTEKCSLLVNLDKQPTVVHRPDGSTINFTYDSAGRLSTVTYPAGPSTSDGNITVTRSYNPTTGKLAGLSTSDGQTVSYGDIARQIGNPNAVRAVGLANGRNPISIIVPCHRVIGADGSLTGYGGGLERKRFLLALEERVIAG